MSSFHSYSSKYLSTKDSSTKCSKEQNCTASTSSPLPHITINSLILLGFSSDEYLQIYSGIAFDLNPLNPASFDRKNERLLQIVLHFLLLILESETFLLSVRECWPCLDNNDRRQFYKEVLQSIKRLETSKIVDEINVDISLLTSASGEKIWHLLKGLSDAAIDYAITSLKEDGIEDDLNLSDEDISLEENARRNDLYQRINAEFRSLKEVMNEIHLERQDLHSYRIELDKRLLVSRKKMRDMKKVPEYLQADYWHILGAHGEYQREAILNKLASQILLLEQLSNSDLFSEVEEQVKRQLAEEKPKSSPFKLRKKSLKVKGSNVNHDKISLSASLTKLVERIEEMSRK